MMGIMSELEKSSQDNIKHTAEVFKQYNLAFKKDMVQVFNQETNVNLQMLKADILNIRTEHTN